MPPNRPYRLEPSPALAELLARDGELDRILDGRGPSFEPARIIEAPATPLPAGVEPFRGVEPVDWDQEERERLAREKAARIAEATALLESAEPPPQPDPPAPKRRPWWKDYAA